jgi:hypothetical protein
VRSLDEWDANPELGDEDDPEYQAGMCLKLIAGILAELSERHLTDRTASRRLPSDPRRTGHVDLHATRLLQCGLCPAG